VATGKNPAAEGYPSGEVTPLLPVAIGTVLPIGSSRAESPPIFD
jgi:hypothetical protein